MSDSKNSKERIGEFLVRIGAITSQQAEKVLKKQRVEPGKLFGEIAVELGYINDEAVDAFLKSKDKG